MLELLRFGVCEERLLLYIVDHDIEWFSALELLTFCRFPLFVVVAVYNNGFWGTFTLSNLLVYTSALCNAVPADGSEEIINLCAVQFFLPAFTSVLCTKWCLCFFCKFPQHFALASWRKLIPCLQPLSRLANKNIYKQGSHTEWQGTIIMC